MKQFKGFLKYLPFVLILVLGLTPLIWYMSRGDVLINGVDTNFPLNPLNWFVRRFYVWNSVVNGGIDFSSSTAGLFFHLTQLIPFLLGFGLTHVQMISVLFWFCLIVFSSYVFARIILPNNFLAQLLFVVFYSFNIYMFNSWENIKVANLSLVASIPFALSILTLMKQGKIKFRVAFFLSGLLGILVSGTGINPSYFLSFLVIVLIYFTGEVISDISLEAIKTRFKELAVFLVAVLLVNSFWIFPSSDFVLKGISPERSIDKIGFNNWVDSLSQNTSLFNVVRLQGLWDWYAFDDLTGLPLYIPYALNYFKRFPFIVFSLLPFALALISLLARDTKKKNLYIGFSVMMLLGIFLGVGTHLPTGVFFRFLIINIPFFSLFRSPWYIFTPLLILAYAGLIALLVSTIDGYLRKWNLTRVIFYIFFIGIIVGNLIYSYPLITGRIFRPARRDGFYIKFPDYIFKAGTWLDRSGEGRVIGYPDDEIEQFKWGYRGIESILSLSSDKEALFSPLNDPSSNISSLIRTFYLTLKRRQMEAASNILNALNIDLIFEKKDQSSLSANLPDKIREYPLTTFGEWNFYEAGNDDVGKIRIAKEIFFGYPYTDGARILTTLEPGQILVDPKDTVVNASSHIPPAAGHIVTSENSQLKEYETFLYSPSKLSDRVQLSRDLSVVTFEFETPTEGVYQPVLERYGLESFGVDLESGLQVEIDGQAQELTIDRLTDSYIYFNQKHFSMGKHILSFKINSRNVIEKGDFQDDIGFSSRGGGEFVFVDEDGERYLSIHNKDSKDTYAEFTIPGFDPMTPYLIEVRYKQIYGNNATLLAGQNTSKTLVKSQVERLPNYPEWGNFSFYYEPVKTESQMSISLVSPQTEDPLGTKILFDDLRVHKVFTNNLMFVRGGKPFPDSPSIKFKKVSPVLYEGEVTQVSGPHVLQFLENYSPEWELKITNGNGKDIKISKHFSANLFSNSWYIEDVDGSYKFRIYYGRQGLFNLGAFVAIITLSVGLIGYLFSKRKHEQN